MGEHIITETIKAIVTLDTIELPENPTNGDMLKAMFPQLKTIGFMTTTKKKIVVALYPEDSFHDFDLDWWNAPYKQGVTG